MSRHHRGPHPAGSPLRYTSAALARRGRGRGGETGGGRAMDAEAMALAVAAAGRHIDTSYDELLMSGVPRTEAREKVRADVREILDLWQSQVAGEAPESGTDGEGR